MVKTFFKDIKIYRLCPEVRSYIRQMYAAKVSSYLTLIALSPFILLGIVSIGVVHTFDYIGQYALWPVHSITNWLHNYQQNQIRSAHSVLSLEEIQKRIGQIDED